MLFKSPIKLNLFLHVLAERQDGYHNIETVLQLADYYDEIAITTNNTKQINRIYGNENIRIYDDLLIKAAQLLQPYNQTNFGADIGITKNIPLGSGLGGGSSNAATVLLTLNKLWNINFTKQQLIKLAVKIGADIPFFILGKNAFAEGVGEILTPIELPRQYFLVIYPNFSISTRKVFKHQSLIISKKLDKIPDYYRILDFGNSCLLAVIDIMPEIKYYIKLLDSVPNAITNAKLTGTGSCIFTVFSNEKDVKIAQNLINNNVNKNIKCFIACGL